MLPTYCMIYLTSARTSSIEWILFQKHPLFWSKLGKMAVSISRYLRCFFVCKHRRSVDWTHKRSVWNSMVTPILLTVSLLLFDIYTPTQRGGAICFRCRVLKKGGSSKSNKTALHDYNNSSVYIRVYYVKKYIIYCNQTEIQQTIENLS